MSELHLRSYVGSPDECRSYSVSWLGFEFQQILDKISGLVAFVLEKWLLRSVRPNQKLSTVEVDCRADVPDGLLR